MPSLAPSGLFLDSHTPIPNDVVEPFPVGCARLGHGLQRLAQRLSKLPQLIRLTATKSVQRLHPHRVRCGVAGIEPVQPLRERLCIQLAAYSPLHLRELVAGK